MNISFIELVIAGIACWIAFQQWKTNENRFKMERYEKRFQVFTAVKRAISLVIAHGGMTYEQINSFDIEVSEAVFLFGDDVNIYIKEIRSNAIDLEHWNSQYRDFTQSQPAGYDHQAVVEGRASGMKWFSEQIEIFVCKFKPYLDLNK